MIWFNQPQAKQETTESYFSSEDLFGHANSKQEHFQISTPRNWHWIASILTISQPFTACLFIQTDLKEQVNPLYKKLVFFIKLFTIGQLIHFQLNDPYNPGQYVRISCRNGSSKVWHRLSLLCRNWVDTSNGIAKLVGQNQDRVMLKCVRNSYKFQKR